MQNQAPVHEQQCQWSLVVGNCYRICKHEPLLSSLPFIQSQKCQTKKAEPTDTRWAVDSQREGINGCKTQLSLVDLVNNDLLLFSMTGWVCAAKWEWRGFRDGVNWVRTTLVMSASSAGAGQAGPEVKVSKVETRSHDSSTSRVRTKNYQQEGWNGAGVWAPKSCFPPSPHPWPQKLFLRSSEQECQEFLVQV